MHILELLKVSLFNTSEATLRNIDQFKNSKKRSFKFSIPLIILVNMYCSFNFTPCISNTTGNLYKGILEKCCNCNSNAH